MWNLDEKKLQEMLDGFLNFQEVWTLEKVKNMTLEEYTNIKKIIQIEMILLFG